MKSNFKYSIVRSCLFLLYFGLKFHSSPAQENIVNSASASTFLQNLSFEWSVGEMVLTETYEDAGIILTQGFLQKYDFTSALNDYRLSADNIVIYPNPFNSIINLEFDQVHIYSCLVSLSDVLGRKILEMEALGNGMNHFQIIGLADLNPGIYQIRLLARGGPEDLIYSALMIKS